MSKLKSMIEDIESAEVRLNNAMTTLINLRKNNWMADQISADITGAEVRLVKAKRFIERLIREDLSIFLEVR